MSRRNIIFAVIVVVFVVVFVALLLAGAGRGRTARSTTAVPVLPTRQAVTVVDVASNPLVYDGLTVEIRSNISDWVTKSVFTISSGGGLLTSGRSLPVISKRQFRLSQDAPENEVILGERVPVLVKGRVRIMDRVELSRELGMDLDSTDLGLDNNKIIQKWTEGSVLLLDSVEKL